MVASTSQSNQQTNSREFLFEIILISAIDQMRKKEQQFKQVYMY